MVDIVNNVFDMIKENVDSIVESTKKNLDNISEKFDANVNAIVKKEINRKNLYPDRINSSVRKK